MEPGGVHFSSGIVYTHNLLTLDLNLKTVCGLKSITVGSDSLLLGCVYRSPNSTKESNAHVYSTIRSCALTKHSHVLVMGDFNFSKINWRNWSLPKVSKDVESEESKFLDAMCDSFLYQHITSPTRTREGQEPSLLDLIITNEEDMVSNVEHQSPLGKSDHSLIQFYFNCYHACLSNNTSKYLFNKADFAGMKESLGSVDWESKFQETEDVDKFMGTVYQGTVHRYR